MVHRSQGAHGLEDSGAPMQQGKVQWEAACGVARKRRPRGIACAQRVVQCPATQKLKGPILDRQYSTQEQAKASTEIRVPLY